MPEGYFGNPEVLDNVETRMDGVHRPFEDNGMKHDGGGSNDA